MEITRTGRSPFELLAGLLTATLGLLALFAAFDVDIKYKLAILAGVGGAAMLTAMPERRIACLVLWVLIHPLSIEKVFFVDAAEAPLFTDPSIAFNASDGPLALLALFLVAETLTSGRVAFRWSHMATVLLAFLAWSVVSYAIHIEIGDRATAESPYALLQGLRLLIFVVLVQSAVRTRGELMATLLAVGVAVFAQSAIVGLSYATGHVFNYASTLLPADSAKLQGFDASGGGQLLRGTGTVGQVNEQAMFHVVMTFPLIALFASRNRYVAGAGVGVVAASGLALVLTFSRGAWVAFPIGLVVCVTLMIARWKIGKTGILAGAVFVMGAALALSLLWQPIYQRIAYGDTGATGARLRLIELATDLFLTNPAIGVGPGEFDEAAMILYPPGPQEAQWVEPGENYVSTTIGRVEYMEFRSGDFLVRRPLPVHNKFLLVLSELGLPGLVIWLWLYAEIARAAWTCCKLSDRFLSFFGIAGLGLAAAELAYMMVEHFHDDKPLELTLFVPALLFAAQEFSRPTAQADWLRLGFGQPT